MRQCALLGRFGFGKGSSVGVVCWAVDNCHRVNSMLQFFVPNHNLCGVFLFRNAQSVPQVMQQNTILR